MRKNTIPRIILLLIFIISFSVPIILLRYNKRTEEKRKTTEDIRQEETPPAKLEEKILIRARKNNSKVLITLEPISEPIYLRAFAINAFLKNAKPLSEFNGQELTIEKDFSSQSGWVFPIKEIKTKKDTLEISLSGFITGKPFYLEKETPIASIELTDIANKELSLEHFSTNQDITRILDNSAETIFYQIDPKIK